jgi:hypothetical protein
MTEQQLDSDEQRDDGSDEDATAGPSEDHGATADLPEDDGATGPPEDDELDVLDVRERVSEVAERLLGQPFDGITSVERGEDGGWRALFEVVERSAVPDTQDIIGRYELHLSGTGAVEEYSLQQRFKRSELQGKAL